MGNFLVSTTLELLIIIVKSFITLTTDHTLCTALLQECASMM